MISLPKSWSTLSKEKKNEEISDGDKESALVNIVVTAAQPARASNRWLSNTGGSESSDSALEECQPKLKATLHRVFYITTLCYIWKRKRKRKRNPSREACQACEAYKRYLSLKHKLSHKLFRFPEDGKVHNRGWGIWILRIDNIRQNKILSLINSLILAIDQ